MASSSQVKMGLKIECIGCMYICKRTSGGNVQTVHIKLSVQMLILSGNIAIKAIAETRRDDIPPQ